jgi:DNA-binding Lrp family transcriptional regulator
MAVVFACPECGESIRLPEHASARRVRCEECLTLVEVPYFPRATRPKRRRIGGWWYVAITLALAVIVIVGTYLLVRARLRAERARALESLIAASEADERDGDWSEALDRLDTVLAMLRREPRLDPGDLADRLARRRERVAERLEQQRRDEAIRSARADLDAAKAALRASPVDALGALERAERAYATARDVPEAQAGPIADEARALASGLIAERGVVFEPVRGTFLAGPETADAHNQRLLPILASALRLRGFLPRFGRSPLFDLWDDRAPYRVTIDLDESFGPGYLQPSNPNRTTKLAARVELVRPSASDAPLWQTRASGKTRDPSPSLNAFASGYIASGTRRDPEVERKLYADAIAVLADDLSRKVGNLPSWSEVAAGR